MTIHLQPALLTSDRTQPTGWEWQIDGKLDWSYLLDKAARALGGDPARLVCRVASGTALVPDPPADLVIVRDPTAPARRLRFTTEGR